MQAVCQERFNLKKNFQKSFFCYTCTWQVQPVLSGGIKIAIKRLQAYFLNN